MAVGRVCELCGVSFAIKPSRAAKGRGVFCSRDCRAASVRRPVGASTLATGETVAILPLADGGHAVIDAADAQLASGCAWHRTKRGYVAGRVLGIGRVYLHRYLLTAEAGELVDHIDGDPCNNRRANLRKVTASQNQQNLHVDRGGSAPGVRGVSWHRARRRWVARVKANGRTHCLGYFTSLVEAGRAAADGRRRLMTHARECEGVVNA